MRNTQTGPAKGQFCDEHFSWLCQAGQGECQRTEIKPPADGPEDPYGEAFDLFEEIRAEQAVRATRPNMSGRSDLTPAEQWEREAQAGAMQAEGGDDRA